MHAQRWDPGSTNGGASHPTTIQLIVVAVESLSPEIVMIPLQDSLEHLLILRDKEIIFLLKMFQNLIGQRGGEAQVVLALTEASSFDTAWRYIQNPVRRARLGQFDIHALDEDFQGCFRGAINRKKGRGHKARNAHHHPTIEIATGFQPAVKYFNQAHHRDGIDLEGVDHILLGNIFE